MICNKAMIKNEESETKR